MSLLLWGSLALLVAAAVVGIVLVVVRTIGLVRAFRSLGRAVSADAQRIVNGLAKAEQRAAGIDAEQVAESAARLRRSIAELQLLLRELARVRAKARIVRALVPQK